MPPLSGHLWTIAPSLAHRVRPLVAPGSEPWQTTIHDAVIGPLTLRGRIRHLPGADACLIVVHGLGGSPDSFYCVRAAQAAEAHGLSSLRLALRGADRAGEDFYHAGLTADLEAAVASDALARYSRLYVLGYSLGGHVTLRYALSPNDARVRAVAAVCAPLDLDQGAVAIDRRRAGIYRHHVLSGLKDIYTEVASRRPVPTPLPRVLAARTIREWDALTVVPRHGFDDVNHYYASMSVGPRLTEVAVPTRIVHSSADPMVPTWSYADHLERARAHGALAIEALDRGGHVGFPAAAGVESRTIGWLLAH